MASFDSSYLDAAYQRGRDFEDELLAKEGCCWMDLYTREDYGMSEAEWNRQLVKELASRGIIYGLNNFRTYWDACTCEAAASNGHDELLKFLHEHGCEWDACTCEAAASNGHDELLKYAHEHGCEWDAHTCEEAAHEGHYDLLKYAHEHGCEWDVRTCDAAAGQPRFFAPMGGDDGDDDDFRVGSAVSQLREGNDHILHYLLMEGGPFRGPGERKDAARRVARGLLWPKVRLAFRVRHWCFKVIEAVCHATAAASLERNLAELKTDGAMMPLAHALEPVADVPPRLVRKLARVGGVKRTADGIPTNPLADRLRRL